MTHPLVQKYVDWIKQESSTRDVNGWIEISSPLLDRHNDFLQLYVRANGDRYELTDDGYILNDLAQSGCELDTPKRQQLLHMTLNGYGISLKNDRELVTTATHETFALKKHSMLQAMLAINDLFVLSKPITQNLFLEDVTAWLDANDIRYVPTHRVIGSSGLEYVFDFIIPKSPNAPDRIIQTVNLPTISTIQKVAFSWVETVEKLRPQTKPFALINDTGKKITPDMLKILNQYEIKPVRWTEKDNFIKTFAA